MVVDCTVDPAVRAKWFEDVFHVDPLHEEE